ncbi:MAG TPA: hypothetical protein VF363_11420 [Candidatus Eisenbacteria bacterium]
MSGLLDAWLRLDWRNPWIIALFIVVAIIALVRRWSLVLLLVLLVTLAEGLQYLLAHSSLGPEFNRGVVIGVYAFGGILFLFLAIAHFLTKE